MKALITADAIIAATEKYDGGEPVNLGSGQEIDIKTLTFKIGRIVGFEGSVRFDHSKPNGQPRRRLDCTRALKEFGWASSTPLGEGLRKTVEWYLGGSNAP
jgi:nucleoside-diphosphate-sugar epimerase